MSRHRLNRTLIRVTGADARPFLQNLLTQDLDRLSQAGVLYGALLSPQGKIIADMMIWDAADGGVLLDIDARRGDDVMRRLSMYRLRAQVALEEVSDQHDVLVCETAFDGAQPDPRLPAIGWRAVTAKGAGADGPNAASAYRERLMGLGVPDLAADAEIEEVFALEGLLEELNGVAFHKGCFIGQENASRMKRRATTRKKFCPIAFDGAPPPPGTPVLDGDSELGSVRASAPGRAIALLRLDRALEASNPLTAAGRPVRLDPPSWLRLPADA